MDKLLPRGVYQVKFVRFICSEYNLVCLKHLDTNKKFYVKDIYISTRYIDECNSNYCCIERIYHNKILKCTKYKLRFNKIFVNFHYYNNRLCLRTYKNFINRAHIMYEIDLSTDHLIKNGYYVLHKTD